MLETQNEAPIQPPPVLCRWDVCTTDPVLKTFGFTTVEMVLRSPSMPIHQRSFPRSIIMNNPAVERFLLQAISRVRSGVPIGFHLLLPVSIGYVVRHHRASYAGLRLGTGGAIGIIQSRNIPGVIVTEALNQVRTAIANRLSFRWLLLDPVQSCRLAMVEVRRHHKSIEAVYSLGIQLIVLEQPGHWLEPDDGP
ncbi:uncharacterized protein ATNIH1004_011512 [Aspergillus tanneri]|uniref:Uncharacterized protein n=1 Tax=Aspergillus tanneri TaxID=1220188 RepID=A0A5M9MI30_9EURO|nr:uncharacterized protein ATNIH1004_011512 [Aspergillus tanneri]KAA8642567.1 hypothetical protein ATNIH1004_011512 [Aspergillus tanneri]